MCARMHGGRCKSILHSIMDRTSSMRSVVFLVVLLLALAQQGAAQCSKGDSTCHCKSIGGSWVAQSTPLLSACQLDYTWQGKQRYVRIFFPPGYDGATPFPLWVQLHGVFWATMGGIGKTVGKPLNATDIAPTWDRSVQMLGDKAVIVYPQSTGYAGTGDEASEGQGKKYRQFWRIPFWTCSVGVCSDPSVDDVGFLEMVINDLPNKLKVDRTKYLLSGDSAGGMMAQTMICESAKVAKTITAAADVLGGIGKDYALGPRCANNNAVPFLKIHGMTDPFITYDTDILVDGVNFISAVDGTKHRAVVNGCPASAAGPEVSLMDGQVKCTDFCEKAAGLPAARVCGLVGVAHSTDYPYPGYVWKNAFEFMEAASKSDRARAAAKQQPKQQAKPQQQQQKKQQQAAAAAAAKAKKQLKATKGQRRPLALELSFPGVALESFRQQLAGRDVAAVAALAQLPAENVTAVYEAIGGPALALTAAGAAAAAGTTRAHRRRLAAAAAGADGRGVQASYMLDAGEPEAAAKAVIAAAQSGKLVQSLQAQSPGLRLGSPTASLSTEGDVAGELTTLLPPTQLQPPPAAVAAAAAKATAGPAAAGAAAAAQQQQQPRPAVTVSHTVVAEDASSSAATSTSSSGSSSDSGSGSGSGSGSSSSINVPALVGGVVGGVCGAALLAGLAWLAVVSRRRRREKLPREVISMKNSDRSYSVGSHMSSLPDVVMHVGSEADEPVRKS